MSVQARDEPLSRMASGGGPSVLARFGLDGVVEELSACALRSTFLQVLVDVKPGTNAPIKPRCPAGTLLDVVMRRRSERQRLEDVKVSSLDSRVLEGITNFRADKGNQLPLPSWIQETQPWMDDRRARRKRQKKKKRKRRRRDAEEDDGDRRKKRRAGEDEDTVLVV